MTSHNPNYFPKAPSPTTITLWALASTDEFGEDMIQSIALGFSVLGFRDIWCSGRGMGPLIPMSHTVLRQNPEVWTIVTHSEFL